MNTTDNAILKIYASSTDRIGSKLFYEYLVHMAKDHGMSGATVYRGIMGFGQSSDINSSKFWELTEKLPVIIEIIDTKQALDNFYRLIESELLGMPKGCLATLEDITVRLQKSGSKK
jgi:PII-like signaling protein